MKYLLTSLICLIVLFSEAQILDEEKKQFDRQDTLRGSITPERVWWDLNYYHLDLKVDLNSRYFTGSNTIRYKVMSPYQKMQIDLQEPLVMEKAVQVRDVKNRVALYRVAQEMVLKKNSLYFSLAPQNSLDFPKECVGSTALRQWEL